MALAKSTAVTSEATGYPIENAIDLNPNTFWRATSTAEQTIDIDLQSAKQVDAVGLWLKDYADHSAAANYNLQTSYSSNGIDYSAVFGEYQSWHPDVMVKVFDFAAAKTYRYWRIYVEPVSGAVMDISGLCLFRKFSIARGNDYPEDDAATFINTATQTVIGNDFVSGVSPNPISIFSRTWMLSGTTYWTALSGAFSDSCGNRYPLVIGENSTYKIVRFGQDQLPKNEIDYQVYNPTVTFRELAVV